MKVKKVIKEVIEREIEVEEDEAIQQAIDYCKANKEQYQIEYFVLKDKLGRDKLSVTSRTSRVPFNIRFSNYRMLVKSFRNITKDEQQSQAEILQLNPVSRDLGPADTKSVMWFVKVYRTLEILPNFDDFKVWLDYFGDSSKPKPE